MRYYQMVGTTALLCLGSAALFPVDCQEITVEPPTIVASAPEGWAIVEPHLALDPTDPDRLLAAAIYTPAEGTYEEKGEVQFCRTLHSEDAGVKWGQRDHPLTWCYDPWVAFTPAGEAVFAVSARHAAIDSIGREGALLVYRSADGGKTWPKPPVVLRRSPDHPTIAVDATDSPWRGSVYVLSGQSVRLSHSRDGGRTFAPDVRVTPNNLINLAEKPVVLSDGTLLLSFVDAGWRSAGESSIGYFRQRRAWTVRSTDGGRTFDAPSFVTDACGPPPHFQQSFLTVDTSAAFRDRLYFACRRAGGGPIVVVHSSDNGLRWSDPVPVSGEVDDSTVARVAVTAVDPQGVLGVAWIAGRAAAPCHEVWFTASLDGGASFLEPALVSAPGCTSAAWITSGDYFGLISVPAGGFHLMWGEPRGATGILMYTNVGVAVPNR